MELNVKIHVSDDISHEEVENISNELKVVLASKGISIEVESPYCQWIMRGRKWRGQIVYYKYVCRNCGLEYLSRLEFVPRKKICEPKKTCVECQKVFANEENLIRHKIRYHGIKQRQNKKSMTKVRKMSFKNTGELRSDLCGKLMSDGFIIDTKLISGGYIFSFVWE